jgi:hypothetical protein
LKLKGTRYGTSIAAQSFLDRMLFREYTFSSSDFDVETEVCSSILKRGAVFYVDCGIRNANILQMKSVDNHLFWSPPSSFDVNVMFNLTSAARDRKLKVQRTGLSVALSLSPKNSGEAFGNRSLEDLRGRATFLKIGSKLLEPKALSFIRLRDGEVSSDASFELTSVFW